jgi:Na+-translocating ferredoxin:NAD+ oxidoreductase RnfA subunit
MYFLIIPFGFLLAMRGARPAPLQKPAEGLKRIGLEAMDFFLTVSLILALWAFGATLEKIQHVVRDYAILGPGLAAFLLSRYQKKTDVFFLSVMASVFMINAEQCGPLQWILLAGVVSAGIALFQVCFLGLRYKLLFSHMPPSMKGWPSLCLLAGFIALVLWSFQGLAF